jgi:hypothetical protein
MESPFQSGVLKTIKTFLPYHDVPQVRWTSRPEALVPLPQIEARPMKIISAVGSRGPTPLLPTFERETKEQTRKPRDKAHLHVPLPIPGKSDISVAEFPSETAPVRVQFDLTHTGAVAPSSLGIGRPPSYPMTATGQYHPPSMDNLS